MITLPEGFLEELLKKTGEIFSETAKLELRLRDKGLKITEKEFRGRKTIVTNADIQGDVFAVPKIYAAWDAVQKQFGTQYTLGISSEEGSHSIPKECDVAGFFDNLDGSVGFSEGYDTFMQQGLFYDWKFHVPLAAGMFKHSGKDEKRGVSRHEYFTAIHNRGSKVLSIYENDPSQEQPLQISTEKDIKKCKIAVGRGMMDNKKLRELLFSTTKNVHPVPGTANRFSLVALGQYDVTLLPVGEEIALWDRPGVMIVEEAKRGIARDITTGKPIQYSADEKHMYTPNGIIAGNKELCNALLPIVAKSISS